MRSLPIQTLVCQALYVIHNQLYHGSHVTDAYSQLQAGMQRHLDEMTKLKAELTKANMEIAGHAAALKEAELNGAKEVCLVSCFGGMFQL
jgi:hypothetical protein